MANSDCKTVNILRRNDSQEVANGNHTAAPQSPKARSDDAGSNSHELPSEVNFSHFPSILHKVLTSSEFSGKVLEWLPHGQAWRVLHWDELAKSVLPVYFTNMCSDDEGDYGERMNCFLWHVRSWGFQEVRDVGPDMGAYWHNCFIKDETNMCHQMHPYPPGGFSSKGSNKEQESPKELQRTSSVNSANSKIHSALTSRTVSDEHALNNEIGSGNKQRTHSVTIGDEEDQGFSSPPRSKRESKSNGHLAKLQVPNFNKDARYAGGLERHISQDESSIVSTSPVKRRPPYKQDEDTQCVHRSEPSLDDDDANESAKETAVSALLLSAGGPPRCDSPSYTNTHEQAKVVVQKSND